jgi:hypothetical protein
MRNIWRCESDTARGGKMVKRLGTYVGATVAIAVTVTVVIEEVFIVLLVS